MHNSHKNTLNTVLLSAALISALLLINVAFQMVKTCRVVSLAGLLKQYSQICACLGCAMFGTEGSTEINISSGQHFSTNTNGCEHICL